jgi:ABC-2 type transport system ATP-binding protein
MTETVPSIIAAPLADAAAVSPVAPEHRLAIRDLVHVYGNGVRALAGVTLDIPRGIYGLLGPNGAGKSTLMRVIATLQQPTTGSVHFDDVDVLAEPHRLRRMLGYLPQEFGVYPRFTAEALLDHIAVLKGLGPPAARAEQVAALLQLTNLYEHRKRAVAGFSGGMRRRFGIAQALLGDPRLVIVDEPTGGLDPAERARFHDLLSEIGEDTVVILSTHLIEDVAKLCPRLAIMLQGKVVAAGEVSRLVADLSGRLWRRAATRGEIDELRSSHTVLTTRMVEGRSVVHVLADSSPGAGFEPVGGDLQDVYFAITAEGDTPGKAAP